jgi:hypothetical protein
MKRPFEIESRALTDAISFSEGYILDELMSKKPPKKQKLIERNKSQIFSNLTQNSHVIVTLPLVNSAHQFLG